MKVSNTPAPAQAASQKKAEKTEESKLPFPIPQAAQPVHQPDTRYNNVRGPEDHKQSITLRRSYVMVVSSYEKVAQRQQLTDKAAEQFAETLQLRLNTLNEQALREIQESRARDVPQGHHGPPRVGRVGRGRRRARAVT